MPTPDPFAPLLDAPARAVVLTDFDGSLAPIVDDPSTARPLPGALGVLSRLVRVYGRVGVVSGRPVSFLRRVAGVDGVVLAGLYGMQRFVGGEVVVDPAVEPWLGVADRAAEDVEDALGLSVERKDGISCVVHWRTAPEREHEALAVGGETAARHGLAARPGRMSLELLPPVGIDKGTAVEALATGMDTALFAGDDRGDLDAFDALDRLAGDGRLRWAVKVAVRSDEAPPELLERADERVSGPEDLLRLLDSLCLPL